MVSLSLTFKTSGPLFDGRAKRAMQAATKSAISELVALGETLVKKDLRPGHGLITGHYRRSITGEMKSSTLGIVHDRNVVYGPWLEGTSSRNKTTRFKGYRMFLKATGQVEKKKKPVLMTHLKRAKGKMN